MKKFAYEPPELAEADFGRFVRGSSGEPGVAHNDDQQTENL